MVNQLQLHKIAPKHGSKKKGKRLGRGEASGLGKTSGRGGKGQTARKSGNVRIGFEGGQMPLNRRIPKLGFTSRQQVRGMNRYAPVSLAALEKFEAGSEVNPETLQKFGVIAKARQGAGLKVLGNGELTKKLTVKVHAISQAAREKIEALGGTVEILKK